MCPPPLTGRSRRHLSPRDQSLAAAAPRQRVRSVATAPAPDRASEVTGGDKIELQETNEGQRYVLANHGDRDSGTTATPGIRSVPRDNGDRRASASVVIEPARTVKKDRTRSCWESEYVHGF
jgi:hypothetical protein